MIAYQLNNYDVNAFVELFDSACRRTVLFNCSKTFYVESVHTKCAPWWHKVCHGVLI